MIHKRLCEACGHPKFDDRCRHRLRHINDYKSFYARTRIIDDAVELAASETTRKECEPLFALEGNRLHTWVRFPIDAEEMGPL